MVKKPERPTPKAAAQPRTPVTPPPNELYVYTTPPESAVTLTLDSGLVVQGIAVTANGRTDAHLCQVPVEAPSQGALLQVTCDGYVSFGNRGIFVSSSEGPAQFALDDIHLALAATAPPPTPEPPPGPDMPADPFGIIQWTYDTGNFDLATHDGCGLFTEAACTNLHNHHSEMWGHVRKEPPQNMYNGHAVDALILLAGEGCGGYDIIHNSVSPEGKPALNYQGPPVYDLWMYPAPGQEGSTTQAHERRIWTLTGLQSL